MKKNFKTVISAILVLSLMLGVTAAAQETLTEEITSLK